ncbi:arginase family protein [Kitasatospora sp. NPDC004289]
MNETLRVTPGAARLDGGGEESELVWPETGRSVRLGRRALHVLSQFAVPATAEAVAARLERTAPGSSEAVRRTVAVLVEAGALQAQDTAAGPGRGTGLYGTPLSTVAEALNGPAAFVVIGAPYDQGVSYRPGARFGPEALRRVSTTVFRADPGLRGMYDAEHDRRLLAGVALADVGDLTAVPGAGGADLLDDLEQLVALTAQAGKVPVVLGGDHSLTLRVVDGLTRRHHPIGVLHFDAHHDYGRVRTGPRSGVHHGNFLDWVLGSEAVACVAQFGVRQLTPERPEACAKLHRWPGRTALETDPDEIVRRLPAGLDWHLSFDLDVLDPAVMPSTGTVLPGGWSYREALGLLTALCERLPVAGLDLVEYLPGPEEAPGVTATALLLHALHHSALHRTALHRTAAHRTAELRGRPS